MLSLGKASWGGGQNSAQKGEREGKARLPLNRLSHGGVGFIGNHHFSQIISGRAGCPSTHRKMPKKMEGEGVRDTQIRIEG